MEHRAVSERWPAFDPAARGVSASKGWFSMSTSLELALMSCALLGLRHGFDYDHLAAISDITSVQRGWRQGMGLGLLYALGHALTVAVLGSAVIFLHLSLPANLDAVGERLVGATLIALALYVLVTFARRRRVPGQVLHAHRHIPRSRIALLISGARYAGWRVRRLANPELPQPEPFAFQYDRSSVFVVGIIHGLGAETPSQLLLFLLAANLGGTSRGFLGLLCFIAGLLTMNTLMTASASGIFAGSVARPRLQTFVTSLAAIYSFVIGIIFLTGTSDRLPALMH
jgi:high-affinity nickel-transport protein